MGLDDRRQWFARMGSLSQRADLLRLKQGSDRLLGTVVLGWAWAILGMQLLGALGAINRPALLLWVVFGVAIGIWRGRKNRRGRMSTSARSAGESLGMGSDDRRGTRPLDIGRVVWRFIDGAGQGRQRRTDLSSLFRGEMVESGEVVPGSDAVRRKRRALFPGDGRPLVHLALHLLERRSTRQGRPIAFSCLDRRDHRRVRRETGARAPAASIAAAWAVASTPLLLYSFEANVDTIVVALMIVSTYFFMVGLVFDDRLAPIALGAIAAGAAWGTKPTGIVFIPPFLAIVAVFVVFSRDRDLKRKMQILLTIVLGTMLLEGFWLARNAILTGNPFYPLQVEIFGVRLLRGWYGPAAMRLSRYYIRATIGGRFSAWPSKSSTAPASFLDCRDLGRLETRPARKIGRSTRLGMRLGSGPDRLPLLDDHPLSDATAIYAPDGRVRRNPFGITARSATMAEDRRSCIIGCSFLHFASVVGGTRRSSLAATNFAPSSRVARFVNDLCAVKGWIRCLGSFGSS